ncbi:gamma carbonic anhydrase family protein [Cupriavidus sp. WKF15]|uniref:gamma carbonic anhydrase family protein n=1 Tax=Cupriavidus sp. WKF15 TaxID=3032282 RepID=UPI0023E2EF61|nr:gamma carbonic anhydrase family protein [Cupriavidus sp. WKF15]WER50108.1 gamma carbonic anhydrase family protein [Cupriavidus sp. WKF15]
MRVRFGKSIPSIGKSCFLADNATVVGAVTLGENSSVWFSAVLRADVEPITIGARTNLQDGVVVHADPGHPVIIGDGVSVGHQARLHGCIIADGSLIGIGATVLDGARIGEQSLIGAGALIPPGKVIPPRSLVMGTPGRIVRTLTDEEVAELAWAADEYVKLGRAYLQEAEQAF